MQQVHVNDYCSICIRAGAISFISIVRLNLEDHSFLPSEVHLASSTFMSRRTLNIMNIVLETFFPVTLTFAVQQ